MADIIGNCIFNLTRVDSTNNYATEQLSNNDWKEGTVILADEQLNGRGQISNKWESEAKKNILMSIVLYPNFLPVQYQFLLSKVVVLGISDVVSLFVENVKVKWPNDIYVGEKKIAGVLIENSIMGSTLDSSIVGIGLNVNQIEFFSGAPNPISLIQLTGKEIQLNQLTELLFKAIEKWYVLLKKGDIELVNKNYLYRLYRKGEIENYEDSTGKFRGTIVGVNEIGQLRINDFKNKIREYHFKEVKFI